MTTSEYQKEAARTCPSLGEVTTDIVHMHLGITTEMGEIADCLKRKIAYGKEIDLIHLREEIGDVLWYLANLSRIIGSEFNVDEDIYFEDELEIAETLVQSNWSQGYVPYTINTLQALARFYNMTLGECMEVNINKLYARYPEKFTQEAALNRVLEKERKTLEK